MLSNFYGCQLVGSASVITGKEGGARVMYSSGEQVYQVYKARLNEGLE